MERRPSGRRLGPASFRAPGVATWSGGIPAAGSGVLSIPEALKRQSRHPHNR